MKIVRFIFILLAVFINLHHSNARSTDGRTFQTDTVKEIIVYEYDTVYVAPDTLRSIDTVYQFIPLKTKSIQWSVGTGASFYFPGLIRDIGTIDSFTINKISAFCPEIDFSGRIKNDVYSLKIGLFTVHERLSSKTVHPGVNGDITAYDSINVTNSCKIDNFYNYLNFSVGYGKNWLRGKIFYGFLIYGTFNILVSSNQYETRPTPGKSTQLEFGPILGYMPGKKIKFYLSPFYLIPISGNSLINKPKIGLRTNLSINF